MASRYITHRDTITDMIGKDKKRLMITLSNTELKSLAKIKAKLFPCVPLATCVHLVVLKGITETEKQIS
jgi:hypothetical protein